MKTFMSTGLCALLLATACGQKEESKPGTAAEKPAADKANPEPVTPAKPAGPFADFDLPGLQKKLQGVWVVGGSSLGLKEAWEVKGDKVTVWNGRTEKVLDLELESPCSVKIVEKTEGGSSSTTSVFVFDGETLYSGLGMAGVKKGQKVVACISDGVHVLDGATCTKWRPSMFGDGKWESEPATCSLGKDGDVDVLKVEEHGSTTSLPVHGDVLYDQQMSGNKAERPADFAAAKALVK